MADDTVPAGEEIMHARLLDGFGPLVLELGGDPAALLAGAGMLRPRVVQATYRQYVRLMEAAAAATKRPDFGMLLATRQRADGAFGPLGRMLRSAHTFGAMMEAAASHSYAHSPATGIWLRPQPSRGTLLAGHDILLEGLPDRTQAVEQILLIGQLLARWLTGGTVGGRAILFRHQPLSDMKTYRRYFGCAVRFGQHADAILYAAHDLDRSIVGADAQAHHVARTEVERRFAAHQPPTKAQVRGIVTHFLGGDLCHRERVAAELNLHPRTMDRRLVEEGTSFRQIKEDVRRDRLLYLLRQTELDLASISERLGFSEQSVMTRSCRKWFMLPPSRLRARERRGVPAA